MLPENLKYQSNRNHPSIHWEKPYTPEFPDLDHFYHAPAYFHVCIQLHADLIQCMTVTFTDLLPWVMGKEPLASHDKSLPYVALKGSTCLYPLEKGIEASTSFYKGKPKRNPRLAVLRTCQRQGKYKLKMNAPGQLFKGNSNNKSEVPGASLYFIPGQQNSEAFFSFFPFSFLWGNGIFIR